MSTQLAPPGATTEAEREPVDCYLCGSADADEFLYAEDDLTGKPGRFRFVTCRSCGLAYQSPRLPIDRIGAYYDDEYIAHRKRTDWGMMHRFFERTMERLDARKEELVLAHKSLSPGAKVCDVGCGAGTFAARLHARHQVRMTCVDFKDLSALPSFQGLDFHHGLFYHQRLELGSFDLITMWHFLEHDYDPPRTLAHARDLLAADGRLVIEVPRLDSVSFRLFRERWPGLQAPQHTVLLSQRTLLALLDQAGLEVIRYLPYGAFPAYFYLFAGVAFKLLHGRGLDLKRAILPYAVGQLALAPMLLFERHLNLAMQTVVCRRKP